jgi:hypothetical protein
VTNIFIKEHLTSLCCMTANCRDVDSSGRNDASYVRSMCKHFLTTLLLDCAMDTCALHLSTTSARNISNATCPLPLQQWTHRAPAQHGDSRTGCRRFRNRICCNIYASTAVSAKRHAKKRLNHIL